jgi:hypothetical protein
MPRAVRDAAGTGGGEPGTLRHEEGDAPPGFTGAPRPLPWGPLVLALAWSVALGAVAGAALTCAAWIALLWALAP